jgi:hypothetical protein
MQIGFAEESPYLQLADAVLGFLIDKPAAILNVALARDDFPDEFTREVFDTIQNAWVDGHSVDVKTIASRIALGKPDKIGRSLTVRIAKMYANRPSKVGLKDYVNETQALRARSRRRTSVSFAAECRYANSRTPSRSPCGNRKTSCERPRGSTAEGTRLGSDWCERKNVDYCSITSRSNGGYVVRRWGNWKIYSTATVVFARCAWYPIPRARYNANSRTIRECRRFARGIGKASESDLQPRSNDFG